jgi:hypothetical protein
VITFQKLTV